MAPWELGCGPESCVSYSYIAALGLSLLHGISVLAIVFELLAFEFGAGECLIGCLVAAVAEAHEVSGDQSSVRVEFAAAGVDGRDCLLLGTAVKWPVYH